MIFIFLVSYHSVTAMINDPSPIDVSLKEQIVKKIPNNVYVGMLNSAKRYKFEEVYSVYFKRNMKIYLCLLFDSGLSSHHFTVAMSIDNDSMHVLTDDIKELNEIYKINESKVDNVQDAKFITLEAFNLTRSYYKKFIHLQTQDDIKKWIMSDKIKEYQEKVHKLEMKKQDDYFIGDTLVIIGRDVIRRTVKIDKDGIQFDDQIVGYKQAIYSDPHETP